MFAETGPRPSEENLTNEPVEAEAAPETAEQAAEQSLGGAVTTLEKKNPDAPSRWAKTCNVGRSVLGVGVMAGVGIVRSVFEFAKAIWEKKGLIGGFKAGWGHKKGGDRQ